MSGILSTWLVARDVEVAPADLDRDGAVDQRTSDGWADAIVEQYLGACLGLGGVTLRRTWHRPDASRLGRPTGIALSATVSEILPDELVLRVRLRPLDGDLEAPVDGQCRLGIVGADGTLQPIDRTLRDEVIAAERAARFYN